MGFLKQLKWLGLEDKPPKVKTKGIIGKLELHKVIVVRSNYDDVLWVLPSDAEKLIDPKNYNGFVLVAPFKDTYLESFYGSRKEDYDNQFIPPEYRHHPDDERTVHAVRIADEIQINIRHVRSVSKNLYVHYLFGPITPIPEVLEE